jgi:hypothetical protein
MQQPTIAGLVVSNCINTEFNLTTKESGCLWWTKENVSHKMLSVYLQRATALDGLPPYTEFYAMLSVKNA